VRNKNVTLRRGVTTVESRYRAVVRWSSFDRRYRIYIAFRLAPVVAMRGWPTVQKRRPVVSKLRLLWRSVMG